MSYVIVNFLVVVTFLHLKKLFWSVKKLFRQLKRFEGFPNQGIAVGMCEKSVNKTAVKRVKITVTTASDS